MDSLEHLAAANQSRSPYRRAMPRPIQGNSTPLVLAIVFGALVIGGAIVFLALRRGSSTAAASTGADPQAIAEQRAASEAANNAVRAQTADFQAFARRLAGALARQHKATLQADNATGGAVVTYTCSYLLGHMGTENAANGRPIKYLAQFSGTLEGKGEAFSSTDSNEIAASFTPEPNGRWVIDSATEKTLSRKTSADLFGVPEKGGQKRDISHIDWFNFAVNDANKEAQSKN